MTASKQFVIVTPDPTFGLVPPKHRHAFQDGNAAKEFIMIAVAIFQINNFTICPLPNSFDKGRIVVNIRLFHLLQFVYFREVNFRRRPFTIGER